MHYIVLDLEWNQPLNHQNRVYREYGDRLIFEMIQIGAVKLDGDLNIVDSLSVLIHPTCYQRIHPRIRRMTHLGEEELEDAPLFHEAMDQFVAWCRREGDDYLLLTWGCDDVSVLQQNLDFFDVHPQLAPVCDIQHMYSVEHAQQNRAGLSLAMEQLEIVPEEDRPFHNALHDAYYTALVFRKMANPEEVTKYIQKPKQLIHPEAEGRIRTKGEVYPTIAAGLESEAISAPLCPLCGRPTKLEEGGYVPQAPDKYIGLTRCRSHGMMLVRLRIKALRDGGRWMGVNVARASKPNIAYIHAKQYQMQQRAAAGQVYNAERALMQACGSSVPFEGD